MTVHLDTSVLIEALTVRHNVQMLASAIERGDNLALSSPVLFEWLRGPRTADERAVTAEMFPDDTIVAFDSSAARRAATLYAALRRARGREADIAIAACALEHGAAIWTLNPADFEDIAGLTVYRPR
jgi:predicted nucleic acid-binding protein